MKILHVWDQAGVACILAKHHRRNGHEVKIMKRVGYDPFGISKFYGEPLLDLDGKTFLKFVTRESANYDVIHVHSLYKIIPELRKKSIDKKLVLHYHGTEARKRNNDLVKEQAEYKADVIIGSTEDLKEFVSNIHYAPNPVDTEHFKPCHSLNSTKAFTITTVRGDVQWVLNYIKRNNIDLHVDVIDREKRPIPYSELPNIFRQYGIYIDIKYIDGMFLKAMSKTGLESLACGLAVLNYESKFVEKLPEQHKPNVAADKMLQIYRSIGAL
jgi:Glycosyltransferase Family 4